MLILDPHRPSDPRLLQVTASHPWRLILALQTLCVCVIVLHNDVSYSAPNLTEETLAGISLSNTFGEALNKLGDPSFISTELFDQNKECYVRVYTFKAKGVELEVCRRGRKYKVRSLRSVKNLKARTSRDIGIDSEQVRVLRTYPESKTFQDHTVLVEDAEHKISLQFIIEHGKVLEINLYKDSTIPTSSNTFRDFFSSRR